MADRDYREYRDYGVSDGCRIRFLRWVILPSWLVLGMLIFVFALLRAYDVSVTSEYRYLPLLASIIVFGLPHGALDHLVPARLRGENPDIRSVARVMATYILLAFAYAAVWFVVPTFAFVFFIALTLYHWEIGRAHV